VDKEVPLNLVIHMDLDSGFGQTCLGRGPHSLSAIIFL